MEPRVYSRPSRILLDTPHPLLPNQPLESYQRFPFPLPLDFRLPAPNLHQLGSQQQARNLCQLASRQQAHIQHQAACFLPATRLCHMDLPVVRYRHSQFLLDSLRRLLLCPSRLYRYHPHRLRHRRRFRTLYLRVRPVCLLELALPSLRSALHRRSTA